MLKRLKAEAGWNGKAFPQFQRCFDSSGKTTICASVYSSKDYAGNAERDGYMETIAIHPA